MSSKKTKPQVKSKSIKQNKSTDNLDEKIQEKAYELYEKRGCCPGHDCNDWYEAERIVKS